MGIEVIRIRDLENPVFTKQEKAWNAYAEANPVELTVDAVPAAARQETGLSQFGEDGFRDRLKLILSEVDNDPDSTAYGRLDWFKNTWALQRTGCRSARSSRATPRSTTRSSENRSSFVDFRALAPHTSSTFWVLTRVFGPCPCGRAANLCQTQCNGRSRRLSRIRVCTSCKSALSPRLVCYLCVR